MADIRLTLIQKENYIKRKADEIQTALEPGCTLNYNPSNPVPKDSDKEFNRNFQAIAMTLKDRNFKVWGTSSEWHIAI